MKKDKVLQGVDLEKVNGGAPMREDTLKYTLSEQISTDNLDGYIGQNLYFNETEQSRMNKTGGGGVESCDYIYYGQLISKFKSPGSCGMDTTRLKFVVLEGSPRGVVGSEMTLVALLCKVYKNCVKK